MEREHHQANTQDARGDQGSKSSSPKLLPLSLVPLSESLLEPRAPLGAELGFEGLNTQETFGEIPPLGANVPHVMVSCKMLVLLRTDF